MLYYKLVALTVLLEIYGHSFGQSQDNIQISTDKDTCSVVNVNCRAQGSTTNGGRDPTLFGPPGKRGPAGPVGPRGTKGEQGTRGPKGMPGKDVNIEKLRNEVMKNFGARSCEDLMENRGIADSGFYILQSEETSQLSYIYCSFEIGVSTCNQLRNSQGVNETGHYVVRPDTSMPSFKIFCRFTLENAITEIRHENMNEIQVGNCESPGCYTWIPNYSLNQQQLATIVSQSRECKQFVQFRCKGVLLFRDGDGSWISRDGDKMTYWGGSASRRNNFCACGETGTCVDNQYKCNCDNNQIKILTSDEGYLTDKTRLPVKELKFGDNGDAGEQAWFTVGKLECMG